jgi:hypothetical protein
MQGPIGYKLSPLAEEAARLLNDIENETFFSFPLGLSEVSRLRQIIELMDVEIASRGEASARYRELLKKIAVDNYTLGTLDIFTKALEDARSIFSESAPL